MKNFVLVTFFLITSQVVAAQWVKQTVNTTASFRGLSVVNEKIVWASGTGGTVIRTVDAGKTWDVIAVPAAEKLDFRDIEAFDANTAYILSIGNGADSRIYKTFDGGKTWKEQFRNANQKAFFDAIACWDAKNCIAMSDPVEGHYVLINTTDAETWKPIVSNQLPAAKDGEAAFAASGTCLYINPANDDVFLVSGGNDARVFKSVDRGTSWTAAATPIAKGTSGSGIFSIAMADAKNGVIVGGNYEKPDERNDTFAFTENGGSHWLPGSRPYGYRSAAAFIDKNTVIAVGSNGSDISYTRGTSWIKLSEDNLNAVAAKGKHSIWSVGPQGRVVRLDPILLKFDTRVRFANPPHLVNVTALELGKSEIQSKGERLVSVRVTAVSWDGPHEYVYTVTTGRIVGDGHTVTWDLTGVPPGSYTITAGISYPTTGFGWSVSGMTQTKTVKIHE